MKKIAIAILVTISLSCKAQSPVYNITDLPNVIQQVSGAYHKDINNLLNPFEGTYIFNSGGKMLKIILQKKSLSSRNSYLCEDILIGEYQYIVNGVEKVNTLNKLEINYTDKRNHSIDSNLIITAGDIGCDECVPNEKALMGGLVDGASKNSAQLTIRKITVNGQEAIKIFILWRIRERSANPVGVRASIPGGEYTLLKQ